jgi:hypothetical protein
VVSSINGRLRSALRRSRTLRRVVVANRHRGLDHGDVFLASYPRSGNTLMRFVLGDLASGAPVDFESIDRLIPNVGDHRSAPRIAAGHRLIKTHEAYREEYMRAVYVVRDVRDVLVSWHRLTHREGDAAEDLDEFVQRFMTDRGSPYGSWVDHVRSWRAAHARGVPMLLCRFDEMRADPAGVLGRIAEFAGLPASVERVEEAIARNSLENMQRLEHQSVEYLARRFGHQSQGVRSGGIGTWREMLSPEHLRVLAPALELNRDLGISDAPRS